MNRMNHGTHDLELLAAYASGYEQDRPAAEALITSCEDCRVIYEQQVQMRSLLAGLGPASMTEAERAQLASAITAALPAPVPRLAPRRSQRLSPIWGRMMATAAALAVVVGVGATIANQQGGAAATTTLGAETAAAPEFAAGAADSGERATATTTASAATIYQLASAEDLEELKAEAEGLADDGAAEEDAAVAATCAEETEDLTIRARGESIHQGREVLLLLAEDDGELSPRAFFLDDCSEILLP